MPNPKPSKASQLPGAMPTREDTRSDGDEVMKFIIWDTNDGPLPRRDDDGKIVSDGVVGPIDDDHVYITTYGSYPGDKRPKHLEVGECITGVLFAYERQPWILDVYRVA